MINHSGWYPPGQVCYPPELPTYLRNVHDLKPIVGVPSDADVIGIHAVIQAANRASGIPGMHDPGLLMGLADYLFGAQMAKYRSKYSLIVFPSNATYTPPALPAHVTVNLESVSGAPSDEELIKTQDAVRSYQQFSHVPSMFDPYINMEISQHMFNLQMARYMRHAGESKPSHIPPGTTRHETPTSTPKRTPNTAEENMTATNNVGTGANPAGVYQTTHFASSADIHEPLERPNQLTGRFNVSRERSNELANDSTQLTEQSSRLADQFNQVIERLTQLVERVHQPTDQSDRIAERFNCLIERFNEVTGQLNRPAQQANQLAERLNQLIEGFNQPLQRSNELSEKANQLAEQALKPAERLEGVMNKINRVLVGIQHAIVRNHKDNTLGALDCLVNDAGDTPGSINFSPPAFPVHLTVQLESVTGAPSEKIIVRAYSAVCSCCHFANFRFPSFTPISILVNYLPALPPHILVGLEPVSGAPSDEEITKVQDAIQTYQELRRIPSMFDAHVNMELSQHLFDLQMARHMRTAGEHQPIPISQETARSETHAQVGGRAPNTTEELATTTNNAGTGANSAGTDQTPQSASGIDIRELIERSNQLAERFNELVERYNQPTDQQNSLAREIAERFNQVLERFTRLVEQSQQPEERSDILAERFNQLAEQSNQSAQKANELADKANQLAEQLNRSSERSDQLMEQAKKPMEKQSELLRNINRVLVGIQHAIVRNHKGNTVNAVDCLVNEKGDVPGLMNKRHRVWSSL
ncbi:hypothetical protein B0J17DRAFT_719482 [Rhizoctonia solani]|nr:hypothetical protein B0J17DRAFT_719482 [Rhizoctonia solani]